MATTTMTDGLLVPGTLKIGGTDIGETKGGVNIAQAETRSAYRSDQYRSDRKTSRLQMTCEITINPTEINVSTLMYALGQPTASKAGTTALIVGDTEPAATTLEFVLNFPDAPNMKFYYPNVKYLSGGGMNIVAGEQVVAPVKFEAFLDTATSKMFNYIYHGVGIS